MDDREVFFRVVEANGFGAAARRLETTPASVSRRVKALEQRLGVRLLQRTTRKLSLTDAGERYFREGRGLLHALGELEQALAASAREPEGELRVIAPMSFGQRRLAPLVARFAALHSKLRMSLLLEDRETDLFDEAADLAIRIGYPTDSSMIARAIAPVPRHACASPAYLKGRGHPETPEDLLHHDCLHYNLISEREEWTFRGDDGEQTLAIKGRFCSNNGDVLAEAAMQGLGITLLPDFIVEEGLAAGRLVKVLEAYERAPMTLFALYPSRQHVPAKTRKFLEYLLEHFAASG
ncbi:LysR family transcriptional regulator [Thiorhodococcus mannitoliphagus]|uniref:LysR family transcriptional regulator n=1 Tax=Thiorhodococcus mannitoliphagus TaxID=329406 RepID=A0A6P1DRT8_9GAMM|nr:LysR family transcriptional regulator [Thiorhodococcus mannitoliphagus]NEX20260.1 LysR family transcriptional regulator [Thiorhodococcus mannitoliphagus]